jgi:hypothetical protein
MASFSVSPNSTEENPFLRFFSGRVLRSERRITSFLHSLAISYSLIKISNAKVQISNEIQSPNVKSPQPPFSKGGQGGIID